MTKKKVPVKAVVKAKVPQKPLDPLHEIRRKFPVDSIWMHNKTGKKVIVLDHAIVEFEGKDFQALVYSEVGKEGDLTFVRPVDEWDDEVEIRLTRPRFEIVSK